MLAVVQARAISLPSHSMFLSSGASQSVLLQVESGRRPTFCWSMIFSKNRFPLFGIMR
jgi:hypothetical protein